MQYKEIVVRGKVQGVFFRATAKRKAEEFGINGKVKNQEDGSVWILAAGDAAAMETFIKWCKKGPLRARVDDVEINEAAADEDLEGFVVVY